MADLTRKERLSRLRREPPAFRRVEVLGTRRLTPVLTQVTFGGHELDGQVIDEPAASVRLLVPSPGVDELVMPDWDGNEFLLPDGLRPALRTFTPRRFDGQELELQIEIVHHEGGVVSEWAEAAEPGTPAAVSGPGRGYEIDQSAPAFLLAGDETAMPAISQLLEELPAETPVAVLVEITRPDARIELPDHPRLSSEWYVLPSDAEPGDSLSAAVEAATIADGTKVWVAGEAAGVQRIRKHLFDQRQVARSDATVRGYWKKRDTSR